MKIVMLGTGYVGLVTGACFSEFGYEVTCVDKDKEKINNLENGMLPIYEPGLEILVKKNYKNGKLKFSNSIEKSISDADAIFIAVGTPERRGDGHADLTYVYAVAKEIAPILKKYCVVITKSTVPVGTSLEISNIIKKHNRNASFDVVSNPEFLREGEAIRDFVYPDRIIIGTDSKKANKILKSLYLPIIKKTNRYFNTSRRGAELIKYASNAFLATKISFINELANLCERADVDIKDISLGMGSDERIGSRFLRAGPAYGGSCFPKDTRALIDTGNKFKTDLSIVKTVVNSNDKRKTLLIKRVEKILRGNLSNKIITFLGVTFKANTDDMRDSSSLSMIPSLVKKGAKIKYFDPTGFKKEFSKIKNVSYIDNIKDSVKGSDLVIIHTEWIDFKSINFKSLARGKKFIIYDMRNIYSPIKIKNQGFKYYSIGR